MWRSSNIVQAYGLPFIKKFRLKFSDFQNGSEIRNGFEYDLLNGSELVMVSISRNRYETGNCDRASGDWKLENFLGTRR